MVEKFVEAHNSNTIDFVCSMFNGFRVIINLIMVSVYPFLPCHTARFVH